MQTLSTLRTRALLAGLLMSVAASPAYARRPASQAPPSATYTALAFYVGGHEDDWELFRGNAAYDDLARPDTKVVFIYGTGGDAGRTDGWWEARERGAVAAVRKVIGPAPLRIDVGRFTDHPILRYTCRNSASYFLRLPDGKNLDGKGYPSDNFESLSQLRDSGKPVSALDKSTTYKTWKDFWQTVQAIMEYERSQVPAVSHPWVNAPDYWAIDNTHHDCKSPGICNPCDHPDHKGMADALRQFVAGTYNRAWWVSYDSQYRAENLDGEKFAHKGEVFFAYATAVSAETTANGNAAQPDLEEWRAWGTRDYVRIVTWDQPDPDNPKCGP